MRFLGLVSGVVFAFSATTVSAASNSQATLLFLKIPQGARADGMGQAFVAVADDATATWWNPAGLGFQHGRKVMATYDQWVLGFDLSRVYHASMAGTYEVPEWGTFGANFSLLNLGRTECRGPQNEDLGSFSSYEMAFTGTYGAQINPNWALGVGLKIAYSKLSPGGGAGAEAGSGSATAFAGDVGVLHKSPLVRGLSFGANLSNVIRRSRT
jgi:long-subunit fatty acid transport protein